MLSNKGHRKDGIVIYKLDDRDSKLASSIHWFAYQNQKNESQPKLSCEILCE